jgi:hypothetical protein
MKILQFPLAILIVAFCRMDCCYGQSNTINLNVKTTETPVLTPSSYYLDRIREQAVTNESQRAQEEAIRSAERIAMAPPSITTMVPFEERADQYDCIALVVCQENGSRRKGVYNANSNALSVGPWRVINPTLDKEKFESNPMYLREMSEVNCLQWYYSSSVSGVNSIAEVTIRNRQGNILYRAQSVNVSLSQFINSIIQEVWY